MNKKCPIYQIADFIGKRWTLLILLELFKGKKRWKRYSELKGKLMDITPKVLSMRLKELERQKLVKKRISTKTFPIKSQYALTPMGEDFINIIKKMKSWGLKWKVKNELCESLNCKECEF